MNHNRNNNSHSHSHDVFSTPHKRKLPESEDEIDEIDIPSLTWEVDDANGRDRGSHFSRTVSWQDFSSPPKKRQRIGTVVSTPLGFATPTISPRFKTQHEQSPPPILPRSGVDLFPEDRCPVDLSHLGIPLLVDASPAVEQFVLSPRTTLPPHSFAPIPKRLFARRDNNNSNSNNNNSNNNDTTEDVHAVHAFPQLEPYDEALHTDDRLCLFRPLRMLQHKTQHIKLQTKHAAVCGETILHTLQKA
eukprot:jgi/Psemu1/64369/estExt_Genemark1.C_620102